MYLHNYIAVYWILYYSPSCTYLFVISYNYMHAVNDIIRIVLVNNSHELLSLLVIESLKRIYY